MNKPPTGEQYVESLDEEVEDAVAQYRRTVRPYLIFQGTMVLSAVFSILGYLFWP